MIGFFLLLSLFSAFANANNNDTSTTQNNDELERLITTLESQTARKELIADLKTLLQANKPAVDDFSLSESLNLSNASAEVIDQYTGSLNALGISDSLIGDLILALLVAAVLFIVVFLNSRLAQYFNQRLNPIKKRFNLPEKRFSSIFRLQKSAVKFLAFSLFAYTLVSFIFTDWTNQIIDAVDLQSILQTVITFALIAIIAAVLWELSNAIIEFFAQRSKRLSDSRTATLIPVLRNILLVVFSVIFTMVFLSEIGIDIMPLLAGAGIAGVAIGFGAQSLVKDFLTGFTVIIEDLFQVGDVIKVADRMGTVEQITLRKVQLRDLNGTVHTIPFSDIAVIDNYTKVFSYYLFEIGVAYRENIDEVIECLNDIDDEMRNDDAFKDSILEPLEILGVDQFADSAVVIKARTKTQPRDKWLVGREFNRRIKQHFDQRGIEIPFPHQTIYFGEDKRGEAPSANVMLIDKNTESIDQAAD